MLSAPPTPTRPTCRVRRRSSSFSSFASPSPDHHLASTTQGQGRRGSKPLEKRCKRSNGGDLPPSPLKQQQRLFQPTQNTDDDLGTSFWTQPSPFTAQLAPAFAFAPKHPPTATSPSAPPSTAASLFSASALDFSLPSTASTRGWPRSRNASAESTFFGSTSSLSSSPKPSFEDSSFSSSYQSDSSPPQSLFSTSVSASGAPSPHSANFTFSCARPAPPPLRRVSSCTSPMLLDTRSLSHTGGGSSGDATPIAAARADEAVVHEAERLHRVAFEQLRSATRVNQEGFVERMRRWEAAQDARAAEAAVDMADADADEAEIADDEGASDAADGEGDSDEDDEVEVMLDLGGGACAAGSPPGVSGTELDELTRRLRGGACELEDFALVREVQAQARSRSARRGFP
ncbi:hypothetical protein JCM10207_003948 [Rhodosporidiobolus poonsookiae]